MMMRVRVLCLLFIKGKKEIEAVTKVLMFPAGELVTLWAHLYTCTKYWQHFGASSFQNV